MTVSIVLILPLLQDLPNLRINKWSRRGLAKAIPRRIGNIRSKQENEMKGTINLPFHPSLPQTSAPYF